MIYLKNDYNDICLGCVLEAFKKASDGFYTGYGEDEITEKAKRKILSLCQIQDGDVYFLTGGTQTNVIGLSFLLRPYEAVISAATGHIQVHETGALEATGHKIILVEPDRTGKIKPATIENEKMNYQVNHMVKPRIVYISNTTELGGVYTKNELIALSTYCKEHDLLLFLDGARLGVALAASDITFEDYGKYCDAFYLGGTKNGLLFGEALVFTKKELAKDFPYYLKNKCGLLAKGYIPALEFYTVLAQNEYVNTGKKAFEMAKLLHSILQKHHFTDYYPFCSNQLFVEIPNAMIEHIKENVVFEMWKENTQLGMSAIRFVTTYRTTPEELAQLDALFSLLA